MKELLKDLAIVTCHEWFIVPSLITVVMFKVDTRTQIFNLINIGFLVFSIMVFMWCLNVVIKAKTGRLKSEREQ